MTVKKVISLSHDDADSGLGNSYYQKWAYCPKAATLSDEATAEMSDQDLKERNQKAMEYFSGRTVGSMFHELAALFFKKELLGGQDPSEVIQWKHPINNEAWAIAVDKFRDWCAFVKNDPTIFGIVKGVEEFFPKEKQDTSVMCSELGADVFTFKADLITTMQKKHVERIYSVFGDNIDAPDESIVPGDWIIDHKVYGAEPSRHKQLEDGSEICVGQMLAENSLQFIAYQIAYNALHKKPVKGVLANVIYKTKTTKFRLYVCPAPTVEKIHRYRALTSLAQLRRVQEYGMANPALCMDWTGQVCPHFMKDCMGY